MRGRSRQIRPFSAVQPESYESRREGQKAQYEIAEGTNGPQAEKVVLRS